MNFDSYQSNLSEQQNETSSLSTNKNTGLYILP